MFSFPQVGMNKRLLIIALLIGALILLRLTLGEAEGFQSGGAGEKKLIIAKADWCGHCKKAMPEFEKLKEASPILLPNESRVVVEILDADKDKAEMEAYQVKGFPTIMVVPSDGSGVMEYPGERTYAGVMDFLRKM
jgi:thiol-disulfide isomerase/thioredoxin